MEYYNKILCVTLAELLPVIKATTLRQNVARGNIVCVRSGGGEGRSALYSFDSMPLKYREKFVAKWGDPAVVLKQEEVMSVVKLDGKAREFYAAYRYINKGESVALSQRMIEEYTINASVLGELSRIYAERKALRMGQNMTMQGVWDTILSNSEQLREAYLHTLPANAARLKEKIRRFAKEGYGSLISGKLGNGNTAKITQEAGEYLIALKRSHTPRYTDRQLFEQYNRTAAWRGWKPLKSLSGMKAYLNAPAVMPLWFDAVHGEQAARQKFNRKQRTILPTMRDALWYGDGTKLNLYYQDNEGKTRTTGVYVVVDAMSEMMLGYYISDSEDYEAQYNAYRMAMQTARHKPYEIVHDNQGGHNRLQTVGKDGFFNKLCHIHRPTMPYNGESKTIEAIFGRFQSQILTQHFNFTGQNITARKTSSRPNVEMLAANKDKLPTLAELHRLYAECTQQWNEAKHPAHDCSRKELYEGSHNELSPEVTALDMQEMFWLMSERPVLFTDQGITLTIKGESHTWEVFSNDGLPNNEWRRRHTHERFFVQYDPCDLTQVNLYRIDKAGELRFETIARPYFTIHRAMQEQTKEEHNTIHRLLEQNQQERIERVVAGRRIAHKHGTDPEQNELRYPQLKGLPRELQEQMLERMEQYKGDPIDLELGRQTKSISMEDWLSLNSQETELRRLADKL